MESFEIIWSHNGQTLLRSGTRNEIAHIVETDDEGTFHCTCEDFSINKNHRCKHVKFMEKNDNPD